jgi:nucleotide-binding universal stress UspA family protein
VLLVGEDTATERQRLDNVLARLTAAGYTVTGDIRPGDPDHRIPETVTAEGIDMLLMGAYGHSRIRTLMVGSTTTAVLRTSPVSMLVVR